MKTKSPFTLVKPELEEVSRVKDVLRGDKTVRQRVGATISRLLRSEAPIDIDEPRVIFKSFEPACGVIVPRQHPSGGNIVLTDLKFLDWLIENNVEESVAVNYTTNYISAVNHIDQAVGQNARKLQRIAPMGYKARCWDALHASYLLALPARAAAAVAIEATTDFDLDISNPRLTQQPPNVAAIVNPILQHEFVQLHSVLQ